VNTFSWGKCDRRQSRFAI